MQIIVNEDNRLLYRGADYISYRDIPEQAKHEFAKQLESVCDRLRKIGYRGVIGFDGVICRDDVFIVEANNRFQGSTYALNHSLWHNGLPSVQQLNLEAFGMLTPSIKSREVALVRVPYSYYIFINDFNGIHARHIMENLYHSEEIIEHSDDGFVLGPPAEVNAYLFHVSLSTNICSVDTHSFRVSLHPAFETPSVQWHQLISVTKDTSAIKTALINQGVIISDGAKRYLAWEKQLRDGNYINIDLLLNKRYFINCPVTMKFANLSPFILEYEQGEGLFISYYGSVLFENVEFIPKPLLKSYVTSSEKPLYNMVFFSTDRLRLQNSPSCIFNKIKKPCKFCEVYNRDVDFNESDIMEAIDACFSLPIVPFRHILIGGRSSAIGSEKKTILDMCSRITKYANLPIYLMCLPPSNLSDIDDYFAAGVTEFGFNIEIFDRTIAQRIMPGKGRIPISQYLDALAYAAGLCGKAGAVRSAFVVGLEPLESLLQGVETVCRTGAVPILSAFRPVPHTPLGDVSPLCASELFRITQEAETIAEHYGLSLGPNCIPCQNNTLNILKRGEAEISI